MDNSTGYPLLVHSFLLFSGEKQEKSCHAAQKTADMPQIIHIWLKETQQNRCCRQKEHGRIIHACITGATLFGLDEHCPQQTINRAGCPDGNAVAIPEEYTKQTAADAGQQIQQKESACAQQFFGTSTSTTPSFFVRTTGYTLFIFYPSYFIYQRP